MALHHGSHYYSNMRSGYLLIIAATIVILILFFGGIALQSGAAKLPSPSAYPTPTPPAQLLR